MASIGAATARIERSLEAADKAAKEFEAAARDAAAAAQAVSKDVLDSREYQIVQSRIRSAMDSSMAPVYLQRGHRMLDDAYLI